MTKCFTHRGFQQFVAHVHWRSLFLSVMAAGLLAPTASFGAPDTDYLKELVKQTGDVVSTLIVIVFALILLVFLWGLVKFVWSASKEEQAKGKSFMVWGVVALFVAATVWGIVALLRNLVGATATKEQGNPTFQQKTFDIN